MFNNDPIMWSSYKWCYKGNILLSNNDLLDFKYPSFDLFQRRHKLMLPWLIITTIVFCLHSIKCIIAFILYIVQRFTLTTIVYCLFEGVLQIGKYSYKN